MIARDVKIYARKNTMNVGIKSKDINILVTKNLYSFWSKRNQGCSNPYYLKNLTLLAESPIIITIPKINI